VGEWQPTPTYGVSRIPQRLAKIVALKVRVSAQYFCLAHAVGDHLHNGSDRNAEAANAR
jgi:hypothetical protein